MSHAAGGGSSFDIRAASMKPGGHELATERIAAVFEA